VSGIEFSPNNMNREDGFWLSKSQNTLISCLKNCRKSPSQDSYRWVPHRATRVCTHCPLCTPISPKPFLPVPASFHYFSSFYPPPHAHDSHVFLLPSSLLLLSPMFSDLH
jgi:hypothetical protein